MENNLSNQEETQTRTVDECIEALAATATKRPQGIVEWMHYGFALRYGGLSDFCGGSERMGTARKNGR